MRIQNWYDTAVSRLLEIEGMDRETAVMFVLLGVDSPADLRKFDPLYLSRKTGVHDRAIACLM